MNQDHHLKMELEGKVSINLTIHTNQEMKVILKLNMYLKQQNEPNQILRKS